MKTRERTEEEKKLLKKRILTGVICAVLAVLLFFGGALSGYFSVAPSVRRLDWAKEIIQTYYYREISDEELYGAAMDGLFGSGSQAGILDRYSAYYTAEEYSTLSQEQAGSRTGIGVTVYYSWDVAAEEYRACIYNVAGNSPAEKAGLAAGMYILGYGLDGENLSYDAKGFGDFVAERKDGEAFCLSVATTADGTGALYTLAKAAYRQNYVFYADADMGYRFVGKEATMPESYSSPYTYLSEETAVVRLDSFAGDAAKQMAAALKIFRERGKKRLILDLRNNGGGRMDVLGEIAAYLCKNAPQKNFTVATAEYRGGKKELFRADKNRYGEYLSGAQVYVLANRNTASASEALMGAMLDYGTIGYKDIYLSEIDGTASTYGKGIMQATYYNPATGEAIKLTVATVRWPLSGNCIHDRGILPADGAVGVFAAGDTDYADGMLRKVSSLLDAEK